MKPEEFEDIKPSPVKKPDPDIITDRTHYWQVNYDFRKLYKNGAFYIGKVNIFRIWNNLMFWLFRKFTRKIFLHLEPIAHANPLD